MNWRENQDHLAECPSCFTAEHFNMPEWRCAPCPRLLYQNASLDWYQHLKDCDTCQMTVSGRVPSLQASGGQGSLCDVGDKLCDREMDAYHAQYEAGCSSLTCPGKNMDLTDCPGLGSTHASENLQK